MDNVINKKTTAATNTINNASELGVDNIQSGATTDVNSTWVWSDEKLSYYDQSSGWYYREDLGYFYFDENNECHYAYPAATAFPTNSDKNDGSSHQQPNTLKKHESEEFHRAKEELHNKSDSELEEGEISEGEDVNEEILTTYENNYTLNNPSNYYQSRDTNSINRVGGLSQTSSVAYPTEIQLAYGIDSGQGGGGNMPMITTENPSSLAYENEYLRLVVQSSDLFDKGSIILIDAEGLSIGRDRSYEKRLRLREMQVSKYHAKIYLEAEYQSILPAQTQPPLLEKDPALVQAEDQDPSYLNYSKKSSKRKYQDLDRDVDDDEDKGIMYSYSMYDDEDNEDNEDQSIHKMKNNDDHNSNTQSESHELELNHKKLKKTSQGEKESIINSTPHLKEDKPKTEISNIPLDPGKETIEKEINLGDKIEFSSKSSKHLKKIEEHHSQGIDNLNQKTEKDTTTNTIAITESKKEGKEEEKEKEEEEEGEITDDGEYELVEDIEEKELEEKTNQADYERYTENPYPYKENYTKIPIDYEPQPQYTCTYHFSIIDMGSTHGTFVNGERLSESKICSKPCPLKNKDQIQIGSSIFEVHYHKHWGACQDCTITETQKEIPLLDANSVQGHDGKPNPNGYDPHPISLEEQRKSELKRLKSKYLKKHDHPRKSNLSYYYDETEGVEGEEMNDHSTYIDRAAQRRELYNTNIPYFK